MDEREDLLARLRAAAVLDAIRWAYQSASAATLDKHDEDGGHDETLFGIMRHVLFRDRLDRVFACGRYIAGGGTDETSGRDVVVATLTEHEVNSMPVVPAGSVTRRDLNFSPGWCFENARFLIASCHHGKAASLKWGRKSPTKQRVASQPAPEQELTLFDDLEGVVDSKLATLFASATSRTLDMPTYVVAHSLDPFTEARELVLGRPQMNARSASAWWWFENLWNTPPAGPATAVGPVPTPMPNDDVPDAPVTLRPAADRKSKAGTS